MVRSRNADLGQYVNPGQQLGVVFATDYAEVRLPLTDQDLAFVDLPDATKITEAGVATAGPAVTLSAVQRGRRVSWPAQIVRSEGVVDERARVTYAVARIADPYGLLDADASTPPLPMGTFVSASIDGASVEDAVRLPRGAIRRNNEVVFVDENNRLRLEPVTVLHADAEYAYVAGAGTAGKRISLTAIESPINGMKVRTASGRDDAEQRLAIDSEATSGDTGDQK
jgi:hypothetical protein